MKILVVGGAGYLGGALTDLFKKTSHTILVYDILLYEETYRKEVPFIYGDIRDRNKLLKYLNWADAVIWLSALVGDPACSLNESLTLEINTNSVKFLKDNFRGRIIYLSTCSVYGAADDILSENSPLKPLSLYARTKLMAEEILADSNAIIFRLGTLYGISDNFSRIRFDLVVNTLVMNAVCHNKISIFGGRQYRPLLHVRDAAAMIVKVLDKKQEGIYNLHSENLTIYEIAHCIKKFFPILKIEANDSMFQDLRNYRVSSGKAKRDFDFAPALVVENGIEELKKLLEEGRIKNSFTTRFSNYLYLKPLLTEYQSPLGKLIKLNI